MRKCVIDPLKFKKMMWPDVSFYNKQEELIYSVEDNVETHVPAGNKLGKDFIAGYIAVSNMLRYRAIGTVRIITTSVKDDHLRVLWGEMLRFIQTAKYPLLKEKGGPLVVSHRDIRIITNKQQCPISYLRGMVSEKGEGLAGHHADYTLIIGDEASGLDDQVHTMAQGWAKRFLYIGNPNPTDNFWRKAIDGGDILL